jgi:hypothetical protein
MTEYKKVAHFECFSGGRLNLSYALKKGMVTHFNADMDASLPDRVNFNTGVAIGTKTDASQLSASLANGWGTLGSFSHRFANKLALKSDFQSKGNQLTVELQRKGEDCCHAMKYSQGPEGAKFSASCMQSLTRFASLGCRIELAKPGSVLSTNFRYKRMFKGPEGEKGHHGETTTISLNTERSLSAMYTKQLNPNTHLAAELTTKGSEISASAAGFLTFQTFNLQAKVTPSSGLVSCFLEHKYNPGVSTLFSGQYDHWTGNSKFGIGLKVGLL